MALACDACGALSKYDDVKESDLCWKDYAGGAVVKKLDLCKNCRRRVGRAIEGALERVAQAPPMPA